eukprot:UN33101
MWVMFVLLVVVVRAEEYHVSVKVSGIDENQCLNVRLHTQQYSHVQEDHSVRGSLTFTFDASLDNGCEYWVTYSKVPRGVSCITRSGNTGMIRDADVTNVWIDCSGPATTEAAEFVYVMGEMGYDIEISYETGGIVAGIICFVSICCFISCVYCRHFCIVYYVDDDTSDEAENRRLTIQKSFLAKWERHLPFTCDETKVDQSQVTSSS